MLIHRIPVLSPADDAGAHGLSPASGRSSSRQDPGEDDLSGLAGAEDGLDELDDDDWDDEEEWDEDEFEEEEGDEEAAPEDGDEGWDDEDDVELPARFRQVFRTREELPRRRRDREE